jgi:hypothetical protein
VLFTENESNADRLWGQPNMSEHVKDAVHDYLISGKREAVNACRHAWPALTRRLPPNPKPCNHPPSIVVSRRTHQSAVAAAQFLQLHQFGWLTTGPL